MDSFLTPYGLWNSAGGRLQFTPLWGGPKPGCSDGLCTGTIKSHNIFVLRPILVKLHIRTRLIKSFLKTFWTWWYAEEKLHFTPFHTLGQLEFRRRKVAVHTFLGVPKPGCSDGLCTGTIESHNFFVLGPILVKFHIRTRLIESFRTQFRTWWCDGEKLHFTPFHTLRQLNRDEARFHHFGGS